MPSQETQKSLTADDVFLALLKADADAGCCPDLFRNVRRALPVRRAVLEQVITPRVTTHLVSVNYDDPTHRHLTPSDRVHIHEAITAAHFPIHRSGRHEVEIVEIHVGLTLSTACQQRLMAYLGLRPLCLAEARQTITSVLGQTEYPVMAHCGHEFELRADVRAVPTFHQVQSGLLYNACRLLERWSQDYRLLAATG